MDRRIILHPVSAIRPVGKILALFVFPAEEFVPGRFGLGEFLLSKRDSRPGTALPTMGLRVGGLVKPPTRL